MSYTWACAPNNGGGRRFFWQTERTSLRLRGGPGILTELPKRHHTCDKEVIP